MKVSVVIPLYNKASHIRRAMDSVLEQSHTDFELIVVDDGSSDGGGVIVREMHDQRIRLIEQDNTGECAARNTGILQATRDLIAFLDADDEWEPCFLKTMLELRARYPGAGMYASAYRLTRDGKIWRPNFVACPESPEGGLLEDYFASGLGPPPVTSSSVMIPRKVLEEVDRFPVGVWRGGDLRTWAGIALRYRIAWSPVNGAIYHLSSENRVCNSGLRTNDVAAAETIEGFLRSGREPAASRLMAQEYLVHLRLHLALACHLQGKRLWARGLMDKTRQTAMFRRRWLFLRALICLPPMWAKILLKAKELLLHKSP
jgi:glycosyltransferase involved in cell wall biosynthesis